MVTKEEKANIEQHMVHLYRHLTDYLVKKPRYMSRRKRDALWGSLCNWTDEYIAKLSPRPEGEKV